MAATASIQHKRGDTFLYAAVLRESKTGPVIDILDWTITSKIRDLDGALIADLDVTITDGLLGEFSIRKDDTTAWPIGWAVWDIEYRNYSGVITSTETVRVRILPDVTYPDP